jgi:sec-independent protein translocase protein TatB
MFDVGISEIMVIAVVALVVIGPERLPKVARTIGTLLGRAQRYVADVKAEVNREIELDELRKLQGQMKDAARSLEQQVASAGAEVQSAMATAGAEMQSAVSSAERELSQTLSEAGATRDPNVDAVPLTEVSPLSGPGSTPEGVDTAHQPSGATVESGPATLSSGSGPDSRPTQTTLFPEQTIR